MNYNEDPDDDGQAQRDEQVDRRIDARKLLDPPVDQPPAEPQPVFAVSIVTPFYGRVGQRRPQPKPRKIHTQDCNRMGQIELLPLDQIPADAEPCKICEPEVAR